MRDAEANGELAKEREGAGRPKIGFNVKPISKKPSRKDFIPQPNEASDLRKMGNATPDQFEQANREARADNNPSGNNQYQSGQSPIRTLSKKKPSRSDFIQTNTKVEPV